MLTITPPMGLRMKIQLYIKQRANEMKCVYISICTCCAVSQTMTWISNIICRGFLCANKSFEMRGGCFPMPDVVVFLVFNSLK